MRYLPFKSIIQKENNIPHRKNHFRIGNVKNPVGFSKNPTGIIFLIEEKYITPT